MIVQKLNMEELADLLIGINRKRRLEGKTGVTYETMYGTLEYQEALYAKTEKMWVEKTLTPPSQDPSGGIEGFLFDIVHIETVLDNCPYKLDELHQTRDFERRYSECGPKSRIPTHNYKALTEGGVLSATRFLINHLQPGTIGSVVRDDLIKKYRVALQYANEFNPDVQLPYGIDERNDDSKFQSLNELIGTALYGVGSSENVDAGCDYEI
jgi:hypothetical protein